LALLIGCGESEKQRHARESLQRHQEETVILNKFLSRYAQAVDFGKRGEREVFAPMLTVEVQKQIEASPEQLYWIERGRFNVFRRGADTTLSMETIDDSWIDLAITDSQLNRILKHSPGWYVGAKYVFVFSLTSASPLGLALISDQGEPVARVLATDVHGNYYKGVLRDLEITNPGEYHD
jgi:hypothetical protein